MKIRDLMIPSPITLTGKESIQDAIEVMKVNGIRHLPVVTPKKRLRGMVTLAHLKQGLIPAMLGEITLQDLIIRDLITVSPDDDIETAARIIYEHKISGMPVVRKTAVVGILTESDILRAFIDMMGILGSTARLDVDVGPDPAGMDRAIQVIRENGGDIINVGTTTPTDKKRVYYFRLASNNAKPIHKALTAAGFSVVGGASA